MKGLLIAALLASPVHAQGQNCADRDAIIARLADAYGETVRFRGMTQQGQMVEMFVSEATGTWTVIYTLPGGPSCMVAAGDTAEFIPAPIPGSLN